MHLSSKIGSLRVSGRKDNPHFQYPDEFQYPEQT
jgi:hypothetical protein